MLDYFLEASFNTTKKLLASLTPLRNSCSSNQQLSKTFTSSYRQSASHDLHLEINNFRGILQCDIFRLMNLDQLECFMVVNLRAELVKTIIWGLYHASDATIINSLGGGYTHIPKNF